MANNLNQAIELAGAWSAADLPSAVALSARPSATVWRQPDDRGRRRQPEHKATVHDHVHHRGSRRGHVLHQSRLHGPVRLRPRQEVATEVLLDAVCKRWGRKLGNGGNFLIPNGTFVVELVIFLVVLGVIAKWILPPLRDVVDTRRERVATALAKAEQARARASA